jgi:hypothetical protein
MDAVLLDTCVLIKSYLCDTLLSIAEEGVYRPLWSEHVLAELRRNLVKAGAKQEAVEHRLAQMAAYFPDARVTSYRREPRTVMTLLNVLASPGQGCPEFARQCRTLL